MARRKSKTLTEGELRIMEAIWSMGRGSVKEVTQNLAEDQPIAYNTVLTMLRILHQKGYVDYEKQGRAFIYFPLVNQDQARTSVVRYLLHKFFDNSPSLLVQNLLDQPLDQEEMDRLKQHIEQSGSEGSE